MALKSQKYARNKKQKTGEVQWKHQFRLTESNEGKYYQEIKQGKDEQMKRPISDLRWPVFRIRRIRMFLGLLDPHPDP